jgi:hypothetical protein
VVRRVVSGHLQQVSANGVDAVVAGQAPIGVEGLEALEAGRGAVHQPARSGRYSQRSVTAGSTHASAVVRLVMRRGVRLTVLGLALGLAGSPAVARLLRAHLFDVTRSTRSLSGPWFCC